VPYTNSGLPLPDVAPKHLPPKLPPESKTSGTCPQLPEESKLVNIPVKKLSNANNASVSPSGVVVLILKKHVLFGLVVGGGGFQRERETVFIT